MSMNPIQWMFDIQTGHLDLQVVSILKTMTWIFSDSIITHEDLAKYTVRWREPLSVNLTNDNLTLHTMPPPGSGAILAQILNVLQGE